MNEDIKDHSCNSSTEGLSSAKGAKLQRLVMFFSWLWPWKIVRWVYTVDSVVEADGNQRLWKVITTIICLKIIVMIMSWCGMMELHDNSEISIYDCKRT